MNKHEWDPPLPHKYVWVKHTYVCVNQLDQPHWTLVVVTWGAGALPLPEEVVVEDVPMEARLVVSAPGPPVALLLLFGFAAGRRGALVIRHLELSAATTTTVDYTGGLEN